MCNILYLCTHTWRRCSKLVSTGVHVIKKDVRRVNRDEYFFIKVAKVLPVHVEVIHVYV